MNLRTIDEELVREAKVRALKRGTSLKVVVEDALKRFLLDLPARASVKNSASLSSKQPSRTRRSVGRKLGKVAEPA